MSKGLKVFITYAHKNSEAKNKLITYLDVLKQNGLIDIWHDNEILPGDKWRDEIFNNLADSDILLYLTCPYSLASENCNKELTAALNPNIRVIPIILEHCDWQNHQLSDFQALPDGVLPINEWQPESKGWQNAVEGIRKVVRKLHPQVQISSDASRDAIIAESMFQRSNFLMMLGLTDIAIEAYTDAIKLKPDYTGAYFNRGVTYGIIGAVDRAIKDFTKAIQLNPDFAEAYNNRGVVYGYKGEIDRAITNFEGAIARNPNYADAYCNRGNAYREKGDFGNAIKEYTKAIDLKPDYAAAYCNRGIAYYRKGELENAIKDYNTAIDLKSDYAEAHYNLGTVYREKGETNLAHQNFRKAVELNPQMFSTLRTDR